MSSIITIRKPVSDTEGIKEEMEKIVTCVSCKHHKNITPFWTKVFSPTSENTFICNRASQDSICVNLVTGKMSKETSEISCADSRNRDYGGFCGSEGKFWEPKNKNDLFKYLKRIK